MSEQATIEAPEFERIRKGDPLAVYNAILTLYSALNAEARFRRAGVRLATERERLKVLRLSASAGQNNLDTESCGIVESVGTTAFDLTGLRNGVVGDRVQVTVTGTATMTVKHQSGSSVAENRIITDSGADVAVDQYKSILLTYLSDSRWHETKLA